MDIHTRKRWYLYIIIHLVNICNANGWLLYRRLLYSEQLREKKNQHNLLQFMKRVGDAFLFARKEPIRTTLDRPEKANIVACTYMWKKKPTVSFSIGFIVIYLLHAFENQWKLKHILLQFFFIKLTPFGRIYHWQYKWNFEYFWKILTFLYIFWSKSPITFHLYLKILFFTKILKVSTERVNFEKSWARYHSRLKRLFLIISILNNNSFWI